ncbi:hypothetical protein [Agathobaculum sp. Marseille-P7918]|uniref:hypothetical protein n=1 Tax=Agathobaculum sp. Marseille-P7918 TaxID=2479843 RepID=UPI00356637CA
MRKQQSKHDRELLLLHRRVSRTPARCTSASLTSAAHAHSRKVDKRNDLKTLLICDENICHLPKRARPRRAYDQHRPKPIFAYAGLLKANDRAASTTKTILAAIGFFYDQLPSREQGLDEHAACRHVSRLLGHAYEDVTRIYRASLREEGERHD